MKKIIVCAVASLLLGSPALAVDAVRPETVQMAADHAVEADFQASLSRINTHLIEGRSDNNSIPLWTVDENSKRQESAFCPEYEANVEKLVIAYRSAGWDAKITQEMYHGDQAGIKEEVDLVINAKPNKTIGDKARGVGHEINEDVKRASAGVAPYAGLIGATSAIGGLIAPFIYGFLSGK